MVALIVLQNSTDSENAQSLCAEMCPGSSHDAYQAITIKAEVLSVVKEEDPLGVPFPEIKAEPEVSCVSVSMLGRFHKYRFSLFYELLLQ
jgi:hypothetical protein